MQQQANEGVGQFSEVVTPENTLGSMPGIMGGILQQSDEQWVANRDTHGVWRVLDQWSPTLTHLRPDDEVDDNDPAVTVFSEGAFLAIIRAAIQVGAVPQVSNSPLPDTSDGLGSGEMGADSVQQIIDLTENNVELSELSERQYEKIVELTEELDALQAETKLQSELNQREVAKSEAKPVFSEQTHLKLRSMALIANIAVTEDLANLAKE